MELLGKGEVQKRFEDFVGEGKVPGELSVCVKSGAVENVGMAGAVEGLMG